MDNTKNCNTSISTNNATMFEVLYLGHISMLILVGNILVILAFFKGPKRIRTFTNYFVVNLALCDLMVGCVSVPFWICVQLGVGERSIWQHLISLDVLFGTTSILSLALISLERMVAVKYPTQHFNLPNKPVIVSIFMTWLIGSIYTAIVSAFLTKHEKIVTILIFMLAFALPLIVILVSYLIIFATAYGMIKPDNNEDCIRLSRDIRIAKTISVIIGLFTICWSPFFIVNIAYVFTSCMNWNIPLRVSKILHYSNSMMNVFVYAIRSPDFREMFKNLLLRCNKRGLNGRLNSFSITSIVSRSNSKSLILRTGSSKISNSNTELSSNLLLNNDAMHQSTTNKTKQ